LDIMIKRDADTVIDGDIQARGQHAVSCCLPFKHSCFTFETGLVIQHTLPGFDFAASNDWSDDIPSFFHLGHKPYGLQSTYNPAVPMTGHVSEII